MGWRPSESQSDKKQFKVPSELKEKWKMKRQSTGNLNVMAIQRGKGDLNYLNACCM